MLNSVPKEILVLDTEKAETDRLLWELPHDQYRITFASDLGQAMELVDKQEFDLALIEVDYPRHNVLGLLKSLHEQQPATKVLMMTDYGDEELWVEVMRQGAADLLTRPIRRCDLERL